MRKKSRRFISCLPERTPKSLCKMLSFRPGGGVNVSGNKVISIQKFLAVFLLAALSSLHQVKAQEDLLSIRKKSAVDKSAAIQKSAKANAGNENVAALAACAGFTLQQVDVASNLLAGIVQSLVGPGVAVSNISTNLPLTSNIYGSFSCGSSALGIEQGLVLTTGSIVNAKGPNISGSATRRNGLPGNALLNAVTGGAGNDASVVSFTITPTANTLTFNYVFASEEYNEYVGSTFNDIFGFFISGPGITGNQNIALVPGTATPVRINTVNKGNSIGSIAASNPDYFINNDDRFLPLLPQSPDPARYADLEYDGLTVPLTATVTVIPGQAYTLTFAIQDVGDDNYDSGVFIQGGSIQSSDFYYSKPVGDLHNVLTWGTNLDGSGANPPDFGAGKTFNLANRAGIYAMTADWSVGGTVNIPSGSQLQIKGFTLSIANKTGTGTFSGSLTSNLVALSSIIGEVTFHFTTGSNSLNNLTVNPGATATIGAELDLYNTLTVNGTFNATPASYTGAYLTFKSGPTMTARLAPVTGMFNSRAVRTETYIPPRRAWRLMNSALYVPSSVFNSWQEGSTTSSPNPNPFPGYGTHITGGPLFGSVANGFDQNPGAESSIKTYNGSINSWVPLQSTISASTFFPSMIFIRGDRGIPLGLNTVAPTATRLRDFGYLTGGDFFQVVNSNGFTVIPNPYQSPVNFATLTRNNVQNNFYVWDPKMGGTDGVGAYVLISGNNSGTYDVIPASVSPESQYIQTNQSFMVRPETPGTIGRITFKESDKVAIYNNIFRTGGSVTGPVTNAPVIADPKTGQGLRITLATANPDQTMAVLDEVFTSYKDSYSNKIDKMDGVKMTNEAENLGIVKEGQTLMLDRRSLPQENDVIALKLWNMAQKAYLLEVNPINISGAGLVALLQDSYLKTSTPINLNEKSGVPFVINSDAASGAANRFRIILNKAKVQSDAVTSISGKTGVTAYPNPMDGTTLNLLFTDKPAGTYQVALVNGAGQVVFRKNVQHSGGITVQPLRLNKKPFKGIYQLQVTGKETTVTISITGN